MPTRPASNVPDETAAVRGAAPGESREALTPVLIESRIHAIRGVRVMLDFHLAELYEVTTGALNQAVRRNPERFPADFAFRLTRQEFRTLLSQSVIAKESRGGRQTMPWA